MKGFTIVEQGHLVQLFSPQTASTALTSDTISMEGWAHLSAILEFGSGSGCVITMGECTSFAGSGRTAVTDFLYAYGASLTDDTMTAALALASSITIAATTGATVVIELDADKLSDGYQFVQVNLSDPGTSKLVSGVAVLSGGRYQEDITATVIA